MSDNFEDYPAQLAQVISVRDVSPDDVDETLANLMGQLFDYFGIPIGKPDSFERLAMALAFKYVPAFKIPRTFIDIYGHVSKSKGGRPSLVDDPAELIALIKVERSTSPSVEVAVRNVRRKHTKYRGLPERKLRDFYYRHKEKFVDDLFMVLRCPELHCELRCDAPCYRATEFNEIDAAELMTICRSPDNCHIHEHLRKIKSNLLKRLWADRLNFQFQMDVIDRLIEKREWCWPKSAPAAGINPVKKVRRLYSS